MKQHITSAPLHGLEYACVGRAAVRLAKLNSVQLGPLGAVASAGGPAESFEGEAGEGLLYGATAWE